MRGDFLAQVLHRTIKTFEDIFCGLSQYSYETRRSSIYAAHRKEIAQRAHLVTVWQLKGLENLQLFLFCRDILSSRTGDWIFAEPRFALFFNRCIKWDSLKESLRSPHWTWVHVKTLLKFMYFRNFDYSRLDLIFDLVYPSETTSYWP